MNIVILFAVLLVCGSQILRYLFHRNYHAVCGWVAALVFGTALSVVLFYVDMLVPTP